MGSFCFETLCVRVLYVYGQVCEGSGDCHGGYQRCFWGVETVLIAVPSSPALDPTLFFRKVTH